MTTQNKSRGRASADVNPRNLKVGRWEIPPLTINTAILLEQINSPFMRVDIDPQTGKPRKVVPTIEEFARTLYVLVNANDPRTPDIIADEKAFRNSVSELARKISFKELSVISGELNKVMSAADQAIEESGLESDGKKNGTGPLS